MSPVSRALSASESDLASGMTNPKPSRCMREPSRNQILVRRRRRQSVPVGINRNQRPARHHLLQQGVELAPLLSVQPQFPHQLLKPSSMLSLLRNVFENGRIREHRRKLSVTSRQLSA